MFCPQRQVSFLSKLNRDTAGTVDAFSQQIEGDIAHSETIRILPDDPSESVTKTEVHLEEKNEFYFEGAKGKKLVYSEKKDN